MGTIVVGVDGSPGSLRAIEWALSEAKLRGETVRAVYTWHYPAVYGAEPTYAVIDPMTLEGDARAELDRALTAACPDPNVRATIERVVLQGSAANVLIDESKTADLVVVGARGHGGFLGLLLGSVSNQVVHHGHCPIVVVPFQRAKE